MPRHILLSTLPASQKFCQSTFLAPDGYECPWTSFSHCIQIDSFWHKWQVVWSSKSSPQYTCCHPPAKGGVPITLVCQSFLRSFAQDLVGPRLIRPAHPGVRVTRLPKLRGNPEILTVRVPTNGSVWKRPNYPLEPLNYTQAGLMVRGN